MNNKKLISLSVDPFNLFSKWYEIAKKTEINDPNAMNLATVSKNYKPTSRIVLLKSFSKKGFVFYTNSLSKKGKAIENNNCVALNFHWKSLLKQVRIEGKIKKVKKSEADKYFNSRPYGSKIAAWASSQSKILKNRSILEKKYENLQIQFPNNSIYRPNYWNGYIVIPNLFEFWQDKPYRMHDRVEFKKTKNGWISKNLYP